MANTCGSSCTKRSAKGGKCAEDNETRERDLMCNFVNVPSKEELNRARGYPDRLAVIGHTNFAAQTPEYGEVLLADRIL